MRNMTPNQSRFTAPGKEEMCQVKINESVFHAYLDNNLAPAWISDEDGYILYMNKLALRIWKIGENYSFKHLHELFPKQIADEFLASDRMVLETNKPISFVVPSVEEGSPGFYMLHKFLLPFNSPKQLIAGQAIDITDEVKMREELRKSNERFSYVAKAVSGCIWDWDVESGHTYRSKAVTALTGYTENEMEHSQDWWLEKIHAADRNEIKKKIRNFIRQGKLYCDLEYRFRCSDNEYRYFSDKGYIIYREEKPIRAIGIVHDITEMKSLVAKQLRQQEQKQKDISRAIITTQDHVSNELAKELHDNVNQILVSAGIMLGYAGKVDCGQISEYLDKSQEYIQVAINEIRKISRSLNTSLIKDVGLIVPVKDIIYNMRLHRSMKVQFQCDDHLEQQLPDEQKLMLYRIIQEQSTNIVKYAEASKVRIVITRKLNLLHLVIQDNGKGFDLKQQKRGTGLSNIRNRVETFSGVLNIITSPGKGCCIEVSVPLKRGNENKLYEDR